jgi:hypothetical protein
MYALSPRDSIEIKEGVSSNVDFLESRRQGGGGEVCGQIREREVGAVGKFPRPWERWGFYQRGLKD